MKKILHVISSPRGAASFSIKLGNAIIDKIKEAHPGSIVNEKNLNTTHYPHLEESHLTSFFTPPEQRTAENLAAVKHSDEAIQEIFDADYIVIGLPMYNFGIPSSLKAWIDHISRAGVTFKYDLNGPEGLIKGKKLYIALSSGSIFSEGPYESYDFSTPYLKSVFGFLGVTDVSVVRAEGTAMPGVQDTALEKGIASISVI